MAITKEKKQEILNELGDILENSESVTFVQFNNLTVEEVDNLRKHLREEEVGYKVAKKTLLKLAIENSSASGNLPPLEGNIAISYSKEATASARVIKEEAKNLKDKLAIVGGVFAKEIKNETSMNEIANIPSLPVLRGMFVNVINSPIQGLAIVLDQIAQQKS